MDNLRCSVEGCGKPTTKHLTYEDKEQGEKSVCVEHWEELNNTTVEDMRKEEGFCYECSIECDKHGKCPSCEADRNDIRREMIREMHEQEAMVNLL